MTIAIPRLDRSTAADRGITLADFLVPVDLAELMNARVRHIVLIVAGALFIWLTAQVYVATTPVPITGQTFGVLVAGGALGFRRGATSVLLQCLASWRLDLAFRCRTNRSGGGEVVSILRTSCDARACKNRPRVQCLGRVFSDNTSLGR